MTLTDEAEAAYAAETAAAQTQVESARRTIRQAATEALKATLVRPDGTRLTLSEAGLSVKEADIRPEEGRAEVVWSDGETALAAILRDEAWRVFVVALEDEKWRRVSEPVGDLADIGAALMADVVTESEPAAGPVVEV